MTMDDRPRVSFGGGNRLSSAADGGSSMRGSLSGGGGMRDSRSGSTALRPSMMHARSSELKKRLHSMRASESSSATAASAAAAVESGEECGGGDEPEASQSAADAPTTTGQWTEHIDEASGSLYWYNTDTRESTWEKPEPETESTTEFI